MCGDLKRETSEDAVEALLNSGVINLDKPQGPTSHQVSAWVRKMLDADRAGHGGTLDPRVTGVLPIALNRATKALGALLHGEKEYVGVLHLHQDVEEKRVRSVLKDFVGEIFQVPPVRAAVKRERRTRRIHQLEPIEFERRDVLFRVRCEAGTYIRTLCVDVGEALGVGGHLMDLRRTRSAGFSEDESVTLQDVLDAYVCWKEDRDPSYLQEVILPMESLLSHLARVTIKDSAVDALCHGADLAIPGISRLDSTFGSGDVVAVFTQRGETVAMGRAALKSSSIIEKDAGIAIQVGRVFMPPGTYPKMWKS
ncbi:MAG: RNA-guided pseudouridylation complex pseudouridine synthase subunit Cbf5 [Thermoplasmata archaeon]